jgi:hypothetical protein
MRIPTVTLWVKANPKRGRDAWPDHVHDLGSLGPPA